MGKTSITLLGLLFLAISGMAQPIPAPATTSQATNLVAQDSYMSPARVGDFWYDVVIPFVLSNGGGTIASNSIAKNNGVGTNLTIYGTLTSTNFDSKIKSATNGVLVTASNIFSIKGSAGGVVPAPATTSQATNLVTQDVYMSPARVGDFWNYVGIPFVLANGGSGGGSGSGSGTGVYSIFGILTNAGTFTGTFIGTFTNSGYYGNGFGLTNLQSTNIIGLVAGSGIATSNGFGTNLTVYGTFTSTNITAAIKAATNNLVIPSTNGLATTNYVNTATNNLGNSVAVNMTNAANQFTGKFTNGTYYGNGAGLTNVAGTGGTTNVSFPNIIITTNYPYEILAGGNNSTSIFYIHPFTNAFNGSFRAQYTENGGGIEWLTNIGGMFCFFTTAYSSTIPYVTNTGGFVSTNWIFNGTPLGSTAYTYYASNGVVSYSLIITNGTYYGNGGGLTNVTATNGWPVQWTWASITNQPTLGTAAAASTNQFLAAGAGGVYDGIGVTNLNVTNITGQTFYLQTALIMENDFNASYPPFNGPQFYIPKGGAGNDQINLLLPPISWWGWNGKTNLVLTSTFACTNRAIAEFNLNWQFISSNGIPSSSTTYGYWITNTVANTNVMSIVLTQAVNSSTISISFGHYYIANSATNSIWWIGGTVTAQ
jgi:hypothetical protein